MWQNINMFLNTWLFIIVVIWFQYVILSISNKTDIKQQQLTICEWIQCLYMLSEVSAIFFFTHIENLISFFQTKTDFFFENKLFKKCTYLYRDFLLCQFYQFCEHIPQYHLEGQSSPHVLHLGYPILLLPPL